MDLLALKIELESGPLAAECVGQSDDGIAAILNTPRYSAVGERFITARTILNELGPLMGAAILDKLEAAAVVSSPLKWAMKFLTSDGIDIGATSTRAQVDALASAGVLTIEEAEGLKALALRPISRAAQLGLGSVSYNDVNAARTL